MPSVPAVLDIEGAVVALTSDLGVSAAISLQLQPRDFVLIEAAEARQVPAFADLCSGLEELRAGRVSCLGHDWAQLPDEYAAALRGRIGRNFAAGAWLSFFDVETNILLPQLHHTRADRGRLRAEALVLALEFGLPGLPLDRPSGLAPDDLARAGLVRAFLGEPRLVLLEDPESGELDTVVSAVLNRVAAACDGGAAVAWLTSGRTLRADRFLPGHRRWRLTDRGLVAA
jgi:phospholipid/cholesterol/gamma-HCH transport system ATP-binding protein